jgi:hypothetical protein
MKKFTSDVLEIGDWISGCISVEQLNTVVDFYRNNIKKERYPDMTDADIHDGLNHLIQLTNLQILKIENKI